MLPRSDRSRPFSSNAFSPKVVTTATAIYFEGRYASTAPYPPNTGFCRSHGPFRTTPRP